MMKGYGHKPGSGAKKGMSYGGKRTYGAKAKPGFKSAGKSMDCPKPMKDFQKTHRA